MSKKDLKDVLLDFFNIISPEMKNVFSPVLSEYGLTIVQHRVLAIIQEEGPLTVSDLMQKSMMENSGNCSTFCKKLERDGYIVRKRKKEDERKVELFLTEKGEQVLHNTEVLFDQFYEQVIQQKEQEEIDCIVNGLTKLNQLLHEMVQACSHSIQERNDCNERR